MTRSIFAGTALLLSACAAVEAPSAEDGAARSPAVTAQSGQAPSGPLDLTAMGAGAAACTGEVVERGGQSFLRLADGSLATQSPLRPVAAGAPYAYHPENGAGGAILHRCNAGEVRRPDGSAYEGAVSNAVCTDRFERDAAAIEAAGWRSGEAGAIRWHGILARGSAPVDGRRVPRAEPVVRDDGYYVSQTALTDDAFADDDPRRYADAAALPYAVVRRDQGIPLGSYGVALRTRGCPRGKSCEPVPFVVADLGPRAGAGSLALSYALSGRPLPDRFDRKNRYRAAAAPGDVLTVYFGAAGAAGPLDRAAVAERARDAFEAWGGEERLYRCRRTSVPVLDRSPA